MTAAALNALTNPAALCAVIPLAWLLTAGVTRVWPDSLVPRWWGFGDE